MPYVAIILYLCACMKNKTNIMSDNSLGIPTNYTLCFQADCENAETCARYFAGKHAGDRDVSMTVLPAARKDGTCKWYQRLRTINAAYGFDSLFADVKAKDAPVLRQKIKDYLGGNGSYYDFHHGRRLLTPEQQKWITALFNSYGYNGNLVFDGYKEGYDW